MSITTQPKPDGTTFTQCVMAHAAGPPADHFADSLLDIERWSEGSSWTVEVSLWSQNKTPSDEESASLNGTLIEVIASTKL